MRARLITTDEAGSLYIVKSDNTLVRYSPAGDSNALYRSIINGAITQVDATNPWRILVYYAQQSRITILDRFLAPTAEIDLRPLGISVPTAVASSADGSVWIYDPFNARLRKLDESGKQIQESNDLRQELGEVPTASFLLERDRKVYLSDTTRGIFVFDRFASPLVTLPIFRQRFLQVAGKQIVYRVGDTLRSYDFNTMMDVSLLIPGGDAAGVVSAVISRGVVYVLRLDALWRYKLPD